MPFTAAQIQALVKERVGAEFVSAEDLSDGCGSKFRVIVVATKFDGMPLLQRQRMVNDSLKKEMESIHGACEEGLGLAGRGRGWPVGAGPHAPAKMKGRLLFPTNRHSLTTCRSCLKSPFPVPSLLHLASSGDEDLDDQAS